MNQTSLGPPPPPKRLESNLRSYRSRMRRTKLTEHFAVALCALVVSFLVVAALDRFFDTSGAVRAVLFGGALAISAFVVPRAMNRWFFRHRNLREVAREVTLRDAAVGDRFLGVYELSSDREEFERSPELVTAAIAQGDRDLGDLDLRSLLPPSKHKRALSMLSIPAAAAAVFAATLPAVAGNAFKRWVMPFGDTERYTFARLDGLEAAWVMPIQEAGSQSLALAPDTERQPDEAVLHLRGGAISAPLVDGRYALELPPLAEDQSALLVVGDVRETIQLEPRERPEIVAANASVVLPSYLGIDEPLERDVRGGSLVVVEGAELSVSMETSRALATATASVEHVSEDATVSGTLSKTAVNVAGSTLTLPEAFSAEGEGAGRNLHVSWVDELGLEGHRPFKLGVRKRLDEAPVVALSGADPETVLLESVPLTFDVLTSDDFGVRRIGLEWRAIGRFGKPSDEILGEKVLLAGGATDDVLEAFATFQPTTLGVAAGSYEIRGWAEDAMPGRPRALSTPIRVRVMTPSEHMNWVTANLDRWMQRAVEVRDREMELLAENKAIHALPQAELDIPETRARLENQARAERGNRARLQGLVSQGQELLAEAARTDEFGSNALDDWAEANAALKDIADTRMDSVAKRLQKAARAKSSGDPKKADGSPKNPAAQSGPPKPQGGSSQQPKDSGGSESDAKMAAAEPPPGGAESKSKKKDPKIIGQDRGEAGGSPTKPKEGEEEEENPEDAIPPTPTIQDGESTMGKPEPGKPKEAQKGPAPKASLGLVETTLGPAPDDGSEDPKDEAEAPPEEVESKTREEIAAAIAEQEALLEAFNKVAGDIEDVLVALENSTFVKRLKAASRAQNKSSEDLDVSVASGFGSSVAVSSDEIKEATAAVTERRDAELPKLTHLHSDMDAYADRLASRSSDDAPKFERVLEEWNQLRPTLLADVMVEEAGGGRPGDARASADFLSDTFDRWGEELVGPG